MRVRHTLQIMIALLAGLMIGFIGGIFSPEQAQATTITSSNYEGGALIEKVSMKMITSGNKTGAFDGVVRSTK